MQIAGALAEAHSRGITHRDLKPANLMLTPRGQVKLLDFGLAKVNRPGGQEVNTNLDTLAQTACGVVMGTLPYMSPEQALGREVDHRSDLFSLGAVLYELATARRPFSGMNANETLDLILHARPAAISDFNRDVPAELERIVGKCLEKDRERRYQSAGELLGDLESLQRGPELAGSGSVSHQRRPRPLTSRRWLAIAALVISAAGRYDEAIAHFEKARSHGGRALLVSIQIAGVHARMGKRTQARQSLEKLRATTDPVSFSNVSAARAYVALDDTDQAFKMLFRLVDERNNLATTIKADPPFDSLHADPRWAELLRRMNFPADAGR